MNTALTPESPRRRAQRYATAALSYELAISALDEARARIHADSEGEEHPFPPDASTEMALSLARKALVADLVTAKRYVDDAERYAETHSSTVPRPRPSSPVRHTVT